MIYALILDTLIFFQNKANFVMFEGLLTILSDSIIFHVSPIYANINIMQVQVVSLYLCVIKYSSKSAFFEKIHKLEAPWGTL